MRTGRRGLRKIDSDLLRSNAKENNEACRCFPQPYNITTMELSWLTVRIKNQHSSLVSHSNLGGIKVTGVLVYALD